MTHGYVILLEWQELVSGTALAAVYETRTYIDWESARDTVEACQAYGDEFHDCGRVVRFEALTRELET